MILNLSSSIFGTVSTWRRRWYARDAVRRSRLSCPVVSVGNLRAGGSGKTPVVETLARLLAEDGERPAILSRGYARRKPADGVTVVSDGTRILAGVDEAGDEPLMLARALPRVPVLVGADRYLSGCFAERRLGVTVHLLDDGFQHVSLERDVDLLLMDTGDLHDRVLPAGRLREPLVAASSADAILTAANGDGLDERFRAIVGSGMVFELERTLGVPHWLRSQEPAPLDPARPVCAVAGIARPERFFEDLRTAGWTIADAIAFRDHHSYTAADAERIARAVRTTGADAVLTTEKDAVRLENVVPADLPVAVVPLAVTIASPAFGGWLRDRLRVARLGSATAATPEGFES